MAAGNYTATVKGYERDWYGGPDAWTLKDTDSVEFSVSACHDYDLVFDFRNECEGNNYYRIMLTDFGQYVSTLYHSGFFVWSEPFLLESRTFGPLILVSLGNILL